MYMDGVKMIEAEKTLIDVCGNLCEDYKEKKRQTGTDFNLLDICHVSNKEVLMCKVLAEIINPNGSNPFGRKMLEDFVQNVLKIEIDMDLSFFNVYTEYVIDNQRRIDIVIESSDIFIPIEVKIYAGDQNTQCKCYCDFAAKKNHNIEAKVYYLTLNGHLPSGYSADGLTALRENDEIVGYKEIDLLSFTDDICPWIESYAKTYIENQNTYIFNSLIQYKNAIEKVAYKMDTSLTDELTNELTKSSQTMSAAYNIVSNYNKAKVSMLKKVFDELDKIDLSEFGLEKVETKYYYQSNNYEQIREFYHPRKTMYPGIIYKYKQLSKNIDIRFIIEVEDNLYCGFVVAKDGKNPNEMLLPENQIKQHLNGLIRVEGWWAYWEYLPVHNDYATETPGFKNNNQVFFDLFDDEKFTNFIDRCTVRIKELLTIVTK